MSGTGKVVVISGPSGAGKSTVVREALRRTGAAFSVSATTRRARPGELDGCDYRFVDRQAFRRMVERGELLEWAEVFGECYGTPRAPVEQAVRDGRTIVLDVDVQGAVQVHRALPEATFVLIVPPGGPALRQRLLARGSEDPESLNRRLEAAQGELAAARASGVYHHTVVNDDLEAAVRRVVELIRQERPQT